ncbi:hypothetical protein CWE09_12330 [Aliidiomarina minuta]|uniref:Fis family transcriptional regulator n=1 Tax=Aliidiomarina minuta TaxID=880057 RepID=A0A432W3T0_9GAMM|nr:hypothetical protein [Aliidiomarina minuta]RUO23929.1 hypothetical protein CWE09_12330 [Aliidiomarina minuta]
MRNNEQKMERAIIQALTEVCEQAKPRVTGFSWLTHDVDYQRFPESLQVTLVFTEQTSEAQIEHGLERLVTEVQWALEPIAGTVIPPDQIEARREHSVH